MIRIIHKNITNEEIIKSTIRELKENTNNDEKSAMFEYAIIIANAFLSSDIGPDEIADIKEATNALRTKNIVDILNTINLLVELNYKKEINNDIIICHEDRTISINDKKINI